MKTKMNTRRFTALVLIGCVLACVVPLVTALVVSNAIQITINPSPTIALVSDRSQYNNGDDIVLTATLASGMTDRLVTFKSATATLGTATSVGGVATLTFKAVNTGLTPIVMAITAESA